MDREIKYSEALNEALSQMMEARPEIIVMGEGVNYNNGIFGSTHGLVEKFGSERVFDTPLSEDAITGVAIGAALAGMRPIMIHARVDFLMLAMNQLVNHASKWEYMFNRPVPIVVRAIIGRGWGQGSQHSQSLQSLFAHIPGLRVIMPSSPYDAKGMMNSSLNSNMPIICIEHRWLYDEKGVVPEEIYSVSLDNAKIVEHGEDATIITSSYMVVEAIKAAKILYNDYNIQVEIIDLRTIRPIDGSLVCQSVKKTGRALIADIGWKSCGVSAEVAAIIAENVGQYLKSNIIRITLPDYPAPASFVMEQEYYPAVKDIVDGVLKLKKVNAEFKEEKSLNIEKPFKGPF